MTRRLAPLLLALAAACADSVTAPSPDAALATTSADRLPPAGARGLTVMTRNLYLGADIFAVAQVSDPRQIPLAVTTAWQHIQLMNFPERAGRIADEIAATSPHLVGLQEVPLYRIDPTGDAVYGGTNPATIVALDYLATLQGALAARGQCYNVAASNLLTDVELPAVTSPAPTFVDIRYTDRDVILARCDVPTSDARSGVYTDRLVFHVPNGPSIPAVRGWASTLATVGGVTYRFADTHLETEGSPTIQEAQAGELLATLASETKPIVLVCDCNSAADGSQTASYGIITGGGFADTWLDAHPHDPGYTSSLPDPSFTTSSLVTAPDLRTRIDLILTRYGLPASPQAGTVGGVHADIVGEEPGDRTASGLWPSDHAGVVATLNAPKAIGH